MSTGESIVTAAEAALAAAQKKQDNRAEAKALQDCVKAYVDLPDAYEAVKAARALLKVQKTLGDTKGQAQALLSIGEMQFAMNNLEDALKHEQEALDMFRSLGDRQAQETVKEALSRVYNKRGEVDSAPNRDKGLAALGELSRAIEASDKTRFLEAMDRCKRMSSVSEADIERTLGEALEKDYLPTARLYKDTLNFEGLMPENKAIVVHKNYHYVGFRQVGGLHYGPSFKCVQGAAINIGKDQVCAPVIMPEGQEGWEYETAYNAGILDGIIQGPFSNGMAFYQHQGSERTFAACRAAAAASNESQSALDY
jgi:tetratricopeptide (TPR) repeat protein